MLSRAMCALALALPLCSCASKVAANASRPPPATSKCQMIHWGVGNWPPGGCRPFADDAPFNVPIPPHPKIAPNSEAVVAHYVQAGKGLSALAVAYHREGYDYYHPIYFSRPSDPLFTIHCTERWGRCDLEGVAIRIPDAARPAGGADHHLAVIDQTRQLEFDLWNAGDKPSGGGRYNIGWGGTFPLNGDGVARGTAGTASMFAESVGLIRAQEVAAGSIDHALAMVVVCSSGRAVYPARGTGGSCPAGTTGAADMGARFQLDMTDAEIDATGAPGYKRAVWKALAHYGAFVAETGGSGMGFETESPLTYTSFRYPDPWEALARSYGIPFVSDRYPVDLNIPGVELSGKLRVVDPCVTRKTC